MIWRVILALILLILTGLVFYALIYPYVIAPERRPKSLTAMRWGLTQILNVAAEVPPFADSR
jgi:hypothetical protein